MKQASEVKQRSGSTRDLVKAINTGIERRGFFIVTNVKQIPELCGNTEAQLRSIQKFADQNGWHVIMHDGNGWLLFTDNKFPITGDFEHDLGHLAELIESSLAK